MDLAHLVHPTTGGLACAVGAFVAGAPVFSDGLRSLRLRRQLERLVEATSADALDGFCHVSGTVALESPLFAPLSGQPCVAFQLELRADGGPVAKTVGEYRSFRVVMPDTVVRVDATGGRWALSRTAEREVAADEPLSGTLSRLLERAPEVLWWRRAGGRLRLVEHALAQGSSCHVVGWASRARAADRPVEVELARTGTDDTADVVAVAAADPGPDVWLGPGDLVDFTYVSDRAPAVRALATPRWRELGLVLGPAVSLLGLLYLAAAADALRALGRF